MGKEDTADTKPKTEEKPSGILLKTVTLPTVLEARHAFKIASSQDAKASAASLDCRISSVPQSDLLIEIISDVAIQYYDARKWN